MKKLLSFVMPAMALMLFSHNASARCAALAYDGVGDYVARDCELYQSLAVAEVLLEGGTGGGTVVQSYSCSNPANGTCSSCNTNTGVCRSVTCNIGYYASGTSCVSCSNLSVSNGSCTACSSSGSCTAVSCNVGYQASGTSCVAKSITLPSRFSNKVSSCPSGMTKSSDECCCVNQIASIISYDDEILEYEFIPVATSTFTRAERLRLAEFIAE